MLNPLAKAITTSSCAFALVEAVLSAAATVVLSPSNLTRYNWVYKAATARLRDSAQIVAVAARRTFGSEHRLAEAPKAKAHVEGLKGRVKMYANQSIEFVKKYEEPILAVGVTFLLGIYFFYTVSPTIGAFNRLSHEDGSSFSETVPVNASIPSDPIEIPAGRERFSFTYLSEIFNPSDFIFKNIPENYNPSDFIFKNIPENYNPGDFIFKNIPENPMRFSYYKP